ncbi:hypothetical protein [Peribacillus sp. S4]
MDYYNNKHRKQELAGLSAVQYRLHIKSFWGKTVKRPTSLLP